MPPAAPFLCTHKEMGERNALKRALKKAPLLRISPQSGGDGEISALVVKAKSWKCHASLTAAANALAACSAAPGVAVGNFSFFADKKQRKQFRHALRGFQRGAAAPLWRCGEEVQREGHNRCPSLWRVFAYFLRVQKVGRARWRETLPASHLFGAAAVISLANFLFQSVKFRCRKELSQRDFKAIA